MNDRPDAEGDNKKPGVVTSYNMPSLLNIPAAMRRYGPLVNLWEGKNMGEGILHFVKSELKIGLRPGWQKRLLLRLLRAKALASIMESLDIDDIVGGYEAQSDDDDEEEEEDNDEGLGDASGVYHAYKSMVRLYASIASRKPVSLVQLDSGAFRAVLQPDRQGGARMLVEVLLDEELAPVEWGGLHYWRWRPGLLAGELQPERIQRSVLLLPYLLKDVQRGADVYAAVSTKWEELNANGDFVEPPQLGVRL